MPTNDIVHAGFCGLQVYVDRKKSRCILIGFRFVNPHNTIELNVNLKCYRMKKIVISLLSVFFALNVQAQVFNTATTLKKNSFSIGIEPLIHIDGGNDGFMLFFHGGYGIKSGIDFGLKIGAGETTYFGADLEWALGKNISLTTGAHDFGDFGLDGALNFSFPITGGVDLYSGVDMDINFGENEVYLPVWIPIGLEIGLRSNLSFLFESEIGLTDPAYHVIGGGLNFYF